MYGKFLNFIKYNNAFTIILGLFFFGFGISFAANPAILDSVYSSQETVVSVDNSRIVSADLDSYNFNLRINSITEDEKNYYAAYSYQTMAIEDGVWQNKEIAKVLTVSREALEGKDLGLYVAKELGENINYELSYLKKVQQLEKEKGESQKIITTEYSGLIGKLLDPKEEIIEGYNPVIPEAVPEVPATLEDNPEMVIVSTQYPEPEQEPTESQRSLSDDTQSEAPPVSDSVLPQTVPPEEEPVSESSLENAETTPSPAPEEMIDEELVQEVVDALIQTEPTQTSETESVATSTPEETVEPVQ
ncbi:MAG: hypothetical protein WC878_05760 [Candidatus Paceibacterota bacterium]|jgi:hypothetical protein